MLNDSWCGDLRGKVNDGPNHSIRFDRLANHSAGVNALKAHSLPFTAEALEKPPRHAILGADDRRVWSQHRDQLRRELRQVVGFHSQKNDVYLSYFFE